MSLTLLKNKIEELNKVHQIEILKLLLNNDIDFTENKNGIFFNLTNVNEAQLVNLHNYVNYINEQEKSLNKIETLKKTYLTSFFNSENNDNIEPNISNNQGDNISKNSNININLPAII